MRVAVNAETEFTNDATALYRLYDATGALLYVGITTSLKVRMAQHAADKSWWPEVTRKTVTWCDDRAEAAKAELVAIRAERPLHNISPAAPPLAPDPTDFSAPAMMQRALARLDISMNREVVTAGDEMDLNRKGLVMIGEPITVPLLVDHVHISDQHLAFVRGGDRWYLKNRNTGEEYRSPMDDGDASDIAYVGRLPRPDGQGTFLYIGGLHEEGIAGAIHYMDTNLAKLWKQVRDHQFSTLIRCRFDPETRKIISSERITDLFRPKPGLCPTSASSA